MQMRQFPAAGRGPVRRGQQPRGTNAARALGTTLILGVLTPLTVLSTAPTVAHAQYTVTTVMSGLNSPRHMAFGPDGALYITEAGIGGNGTSMVDGGGTTVAYGNTSEIARLDLSTLAQTTVFTGGPSLAPAGGAGATGFHSIAFSGGQAFGLIGFGTDPAVRSTFNQGANAGQEAGAANFAQLVRLSLDGTNTITPVADIGAYEGAANPDGAELNTNPFGLTALSGGGFVVADAGGNSLLGVTAGGAISTLSVLPALPNPLFGTVGGPTYEAVPTSVAVNPLNGNYYFTQLTGFPFIQGAANIFAYDPTGGTTTTAFSGFTNLIDLTFDPVGNLYALQYTTNGLASPNGPGAGQLIRIAPDGTRTTLLDSGLFFPTAVAYGADGSIYVANNGVAPGGGQVLRLTATAPEPTTLGLLALGLGAAGSAGSIRLKARIRRSRAA